MNKKLPMILSIAAIVISVAAICFSIFRTPSYEMDFLSLIVGILTFLVAVLAVFLGYNYLIFENRILKALDKKIKETDEKF